MMTESIPNRSLMSLLMAGLLACAPTPVWSQPDPAAAGRTAGAAASDGESAETTASPVESDPWVRAILEVKPVTPEQWLQDIRALMDLSRPDLAKEYLRAFSEAMPSAAALPPLYARFGSAFFLRLATREDLQPEGAAVADTILQAVDAHRRDPQRLAAMVQQLDDEDPAARRRAMVELVQIGPPVVAPLLRVLAETERADLRARVTATLVALGPPAADPLIAALEASSPLLRIRVIEVLGQLQAQQAVPTLLPLGSPLEPDTTVREAAQQTLRHLLGDLPDTRGEAVTLLTRQLNSYLAGTLPGRADEWERVSVWRWDEAQQGPVAESLPADDARLVAAAHTARWLYKLAPDVAEHRHWYLATALEQAQRQSGFDRPLAESDYPIVGEAVAAGPAVLEAVLLWARRQRLDGAVMAIIDLLGQIGDESLLHGTAGTPSVLAQSLRSPDRRVQLAAARAIMRLDPSGPFAGASYLPEVLGFLSASSGLRRVLIGDPRAEVARTLAGLFTELGFQVDTHVTGRPLLLQAFTSPDYVFLLVSDAIDRPGYRALIQTLRRDPRTGDLPIGLMVRAIYEAPGSPLVESDPLTLAFGQPQTAEDVARDTRRLLEAAGRRHVPLEHRLDQASFALDALVQLAQDPDRYHFYDLLRVEGAVRQALMHSPLAAQAAHLLGLFGTPSAQQALVEYAGTHAHPLAHRQAAVEGFRAAVERRGVLLTAAQLRRQYDWYNASEVLDGETQQVLASILDIIEAPSRQVNAPPPQE
jgi:CheY-like chemotaxis protein